MNPHAAELNKMSGRVTAERFEPSAPPAPSDSQQAHTTDGFIPAQYPSILPNQPGSSNNEYPLIVPVASQTSKAPHQMVPPVAGAQGSSSAPHAQCAHPRLHLINPTQPNHPESHSSPRHTTAIPTHMHAMHATPVHPMHPTHRTPTHTPYTLPSQPLPTCSPHPQPPSVAPPAPPALPRTRRP